MLPAADNYNKTIVPSGSLGLDICLGCGGYLPGTIVEIFGLPETGRTTLCLHAVANAQLQQKYCAWIETSPGFYLQYADDCGVQISKLFYSAPHALEQALDTIYLLAKSGAFSVIVLDSLPGLLYNPKITFGKIDSVDEYSYDYFSHSLNKISAAIQKTGAIILITNLIDKSLSSTYHHLARHIGKISLNLYASTRIRLKSAIIQDGNSIGGHRIFAKVVKNILISPRNSTEFDIIMDRGINRQAEIFKLGLAEDLIRNQDDGYFYRYDYLGATHSEAVSCLIDNPTMSYSIETAIRQKMIPQYS